MEQQQRSLIFTAAVGLIILAIIVGSIYYLVKFIQGRVASNDQTPSPAATQIAGDFAIPSSTSFIETSSVSPAASGAAQAPQTGNTQPNTNPASDKKAYNGGTFQLTYLKSWGTLTCNNGSNFELDPVNSADSRIACDVALKPVTIIVADNSGCEGQAAKIGNVEVTKSQATEAGYTKYQWCTKTTPVLNITHRVSQGGERATSKQDFSKQIEEMISSLSFTRGL